ncbi:MAG: threonine synthase [Epulopiscium sp.]|nr:threonine synthase [Candidatus Epulonipiscium sp.]
MWIKCGIIKKEYESTKEEVLMITYRSTRGGEEGTRASQAILKGIANDGGLFVPEYIPEMDFSLSDMKEMEYKELAYRVMRLYFADFSKEELQSCIDGAYDSKFANDLIAPVNTAGDLKFLELFHGPTLAFKDMALSILPYLMMTSAKKEKIDKDVVILTATSGDTGKAALEGFANVDGTKIIVFFPQNGVSEIQKRQMITQEGENTCVIGINGNFDDAQTGVKNIFADLEFREELDKNGYVFSSANSINIGRLIPQVVYYFHSYSQLMQDGTLEEGDTMNVVVPTGNFGNILAAYYAKQMGLPIGDLICASNSNKVLYDFFQDGSYDKNRDFNITMSPSMDILISSNLERLLYYVANDDAELTKDLMDQLQKQGKYDITSEMKENLIDFYGGYADDVRTQEVIKEVYESTGYLMDTHTAVAYAVYEDYKADRSDSTATVIVSTASPYKFPSSVMDALDSEAYKETDEFELVDKMNDIIGGEIPKGIDGLKTRKIEHDIVCQTNEMAKVIKEFLKLV